MKPSLLALESNFSATASRFTCSSSRRRRSRSRSFRRLTIGETLPRCAVLPRSRNDTGTTARGASLQDVEVGTGSSTSADNIPRRRHDPIPNAASAILCDTSAVAELLKKAASRKKSARRDAAPSPMRDNRVTLAVSVRTAANACCAI